MNDDITHRVTKLVAEVLDLPPDAITPASCFYKDLDADSLHHVEILMAVEDEWLLDAVEDDDAEKIKTVADLIALVESRTGAEREIASA